MEIIYFESGSGKRVPIVQYLPEFLKDWKLILKSNFQEKYLCVGLKQGQD